MKTPTLKQIKEGPVGQMIPMCSGTITNIDEFQKGSVEGTDWTLQNIMISDDSAELPVRIGNHAEIPKEWKGQRVLIMAHRKTKGGLSGVKLEEEAYNDGGTVKTFRQISMAKSGEIVLDNQSQQVDDANLVEGFVGEETVPPSTAPAPVQAGIPSKPSQKIKPVAVPPGTTFTELRYERTVNTGNYCSEKMGVTVAIGDGATPEDALVAAQIFLERYMLKEVVPATAKVV